MRLGGMSIHAQMGTGITSMDENTLYRTLNNPDSVFIVQWKFIRYVGQ